MLLPYIEQANLYNRFNFNWATGYFNATPGGAASGTIMGGTDPNVNTNLNLSKIRIEGFLCPSDAGPVSHPSVDAYYGCGVADSMRASYGFSVRQYQGNGYNLYKDLKTNNAQRNAMFGLNSYSQIRDIKDGTSNSVAMIESTLDLYDGRQLSWACSSHVGQGIALDQPEGINNWNCCAWTTPPYGLITPIAGRRGEWGTAGSTHDGGIQVLMGDGAVRFLSQNINTSTRNNLGYIADGQVLGEF